MTAAARKTPPPPPDVERRRVAVELVRRQRMSIRASARTVGVSKEAVRKWLAIVSRGGMEALAAIDRRRGPVPKVTEAEVRALVAEAARLGKAGSLSEVHALARRFLGSDISRSGLRLHLIRLGLWPASRARAA